MLDWIQNGYKLPLFSEPPRSVKHNQQSALANKQFVDQAVTELLNNGCVCRVSTIPHVCSPLSVVTSTKGKKRLVINLRYLNQYLRRDSFKYEDLRTLMAILMPNDFLFKFDLKSGYHHVEIFQPHWTYLGFSWGSQGHMDYYVFTVLPFGLATACYVFTKLLRPLVKWWRGQGLRAVVYLDDGIVATAGLEAAMHASSTVQTTLQRAGLVVNIEKSQWNPTQSLTWLGFSLDLSQGTVSVPDHKIEALRNTLAAILDKDAIPAKQIASTYSR